MKTRYFKINPDKKEFFVKFHQEKKRILSSTPTNCYNYGISINYSEVGEIIILRNELCLLGELDTNIFLNRNIIFIPTEYDKEKDVVYGSCLNAVIIRSQQLNPTYLPLLHVNDHLVGVVESICEHGVFVNLGGPIGFIPDARLLTKDIVPGNFIEVNIVRIDFPKEQISLTEIQTDYYGNKIFGGIDNAEDYPDA